MWKIFHLFLHIGWTLFHIALY